MSDAQWVGYHIRIICLRLRGKPVAGDQRLTDEHTAVISELRIIRTGRSGQQQYQARRTLVRDFPEYQRAQGARSSASSGLPPGPPRRHQSGGGPTDADPNQRTGRWLQHHMAFPEDDPKVR